MAFTFDPEKTIAAAALLVGETKESMYTVLKMLYLADRLHLEKYGRPITGDRYFALPEGPAGTETYDLMKYLRGERQFTTFPLARELLRVDPKTYRIDVLRDPDLTVFSKSDLACLKDVADICNRRGGAHIRDLAHDKAWEATGRNKPMDITTIASQLGNGPLLAQHLSDRFPGSA